MRDALRGHWPEYLMEACELGLFMISAATFGVLLEHPDSPLHLAIPAPFVRRVLGGCAMGLTAIGIICSPWGKQSGAHMNPSLTLAFLRLGKVKRADALFYMVAQFIGGVAGVIVAHTFLGSLLDHPAVDYVITIPGAWGNLGAFAGEVVIAFLMMSMVLQVSNAGPASRYTGYFAGLLIALYITFESPLSGMSMNPARTFGSALTAMRWDALWIYFTAPPVAMLAAAEVYVWQRGRQSVACAKLHHDNNKRCIHCGANMAG